MTYQITYTSAQLRSLIKRGAQYLVVIADTAYRGEVLSWHKSHEAAARKAGDSGWYSVVDIDDAISYASDRSGQ